MKIPNTLKSGLRYGHYKVHTQVYMYMCRLQKGRVQRVCKCAFCTRTNSHRYRIYMNSYTHTHTRTYTHTDTHTRTYTHVHIHKHTHTQTLTHESIHGNIFFYASTEDQFWQRSRYRLKCGPGWRVLLGQPWWAPGGVYGWNLACQWVNLTVPMGPHGWIWVNLDGSPDDRQCAYEWTWVKCALGWIWMCPWVELGVLMGDPGFTTWMNLSDLRCAPSWT